MGEKVVSSLPSLLETAEKLMPDTGFLDGGDLTIADTYMYTLLTGIKSGVLEYIPVDLCDKYEKLMALKKKVESIPAVKAYYKL